MAYIRKRGDTYCFTVDAGKHKDGSRRQLTGSGFESIKLAEKAAAKVVKDHDEGKRLDNTTVQKFIEMFMEEEVKNQVEEGTYLNQFQQARDHIYPKLGKKKINKVTYQDIKDYYNHLLESGMARGLIKSIAMILRKSFKTALMWGYVTHDATQNVKPPTYKPRRMQVWNTGEVQKFLKAQDNILYVLALSTGMRMGEMLALEWADIDFGTKRITVNKSLKFSPTKGLHPKATKTKNSMRTIDIQESTIQALREYKSKQLFETKIICDYLGGYTYPSTAWRTFIDDCKTHNMPPIRFHDLRHTHATMLFNMGFNATVVAERLGNTVQTTLVTYSHVLPSMQKEVADRLNSLF